MGERRGRREKLQSTIATRPYCNLAAGWAANLANRLGHLKGADSVHIGGNDGNAIVIVLRVAELERSAEVDLRSVRVLQDHAARKADRPSSPRSPPTCS